MAACGICGNKAGLLKDTCAACENRQREEQEAANQARREAEQEVWEAEVQEKLEVWVEKANASLKAGETIFLYQTVFVSVDSSTDSDGVLANFNLMGLQARGLAGWKVESIIPKTYGSALQNTQTTQYGTTTLYAGGMGGNVIGAYVVLSKEVTTLDRNQLGTYTINIARELIEEGYAI